MFRAHESEPDRLVAVKVFRLEITPEQASLFVDELQKLVDANIAHPAIAAPIAAGLQDGEPYLAREYAIGDSLDVVLRDRGLLSIEEALPLVESLSAAIAHAAARGVHHGSLHPRDIIVSDAGVRITGFGIAAALAKISAKLPVRPLYSAPDASDVYSLGAIAFEAMTGKRVSPANLEEFRIAHGGEVRGALATVLAATGLKATTGVTPARKASPPRDTVGTTTAAGASNVDMRAPDAQVKPVSRPAVQDLDLRIDRAVDLNLKPARTLDPVADHADHPGSRVGRRPIVAAFLVFAALVALAVGFFLKSPAPVVVRDQETTVKETTVDLPAKPPADDTARISKPPLPAPTPSRSASGAIARPQPTRGSLLIRSTPADADVLLNGSARGKTPLVVRDLPLGSYTIRVARDGYVGDERTLQLTAQRPTAATTFELRTGSVVPGGADAALDDPRGARGVRDPGAPGALTVQSRPAGARVFVNDRLVGSTPMSVADLPAGPATVRIELDGYQSWATTVQVGSGAQTRVAASLERK